MCFRSLVLPAALMTLCLMGCAPQFPLGMQQAEWQALSPEQKLQAREAQAVLDEKEAERRRRERAEAEKMAAEQRRRRELRIERLYATAEFGDILQCRVDHPFVAAAGQWQAALPTAFQVVRGEERALEFVSREWGWSNFVWVRLSMDGLTLTLCPSHQSVQTFTRTSACSRLTGTTYELTRGKSAKIEVPGYLLGESFCVLAPAPGMPPSLIIERRHAPPPW